jgi:hypothetical protein
MIRRDATFISEEKYHAIPIEAMFPFGRRQRLVQKLRSRTTGQGNEDPTVAMNRLFAGSAEKIARFMDPLLTVSIKEDFRMGRHINGDARDGAVLGEEFCGECPPRHTTKA